VLKGEGQVEGVTMYEAGRNKAQPSTHFIAWRVLEDKIVSKVNLVKKGIIVENGVCNMCGERKQCLTSFVHVE